MPDFVINDALFKQDITKLAALARRMTELDDDYRSALLESGVKMR